MESFEKKYGKWAFVAGGSRGLGGAWSEALAKRGLNLAMVARGEEKLVGKAEQLREGYGVEVRTKAVDLASDEMLDQVDELTRDLEVGLLVYNAGIWAKTLVSTL